MSSNVPPIQPPCPAVIATLLDQIERGEPRSDHVFRFDYIGNVFLVVLMHRGVMVHWQVEACCDYVQASVLMERYKDFSRSSRSGPPLVAPPIKAPSDAMLTELHAEIARGELASGPIVLFDEPRRVFLYVKIEHGAIVYWQMECCHDQATAGLLTRIWLQVNGIALPTARDPGASMH